jgi:hypothetical protein
MQNGQKWSTADQFDGQYFNKEGVKMTQDQLIKIDQNQSKPRAIYSPCKKVKSGQKSITVMDNRSLKKV